MAEPQISRQDPSSWSNWKNPLLVAGALALAACSGSSESSAQTTPITVSASSTAREASRSSAPSTTAAATVASQPATETTVAIAIETTATGPSTGCRTEDGLEFAEGFERTDGSSCVDGEWTTPTTTPPTTIFTQSEQVMNNRLVVSGLANDDPELAEFRDALVAAFEQDLLYDRVNIVSGAVDGDVPYIVIDATSGYSTSEYQIDKAEEAVYFMATQLWGENRFGATTPDGDGAVGFSFTSDGREYRIPPDAMVSVFERQLSASQAMSSQFVD